MAQIKEDVVKVASLKYSSQLSAKVLSFFNNHEELNELAEKNELVHYKLTNPISKKVNYLFMTEDVNRFIEEQMIEKSLFTNSVKRTFLSFNDKSTCLTKEIPFELNSYRNEVYELPIENIVTPSGVYFLYKDENLVYIGQTINVANRVCTHLMEELKDFNKCFFIKIRKEDLFETETKLIRHFKPKYNLTIKKK
jgi:hypothetical protein